MKTAIDSEKICELMEQVLVRISAAYEEAEILQSAVEEASAALPCLIGLADDLTENAAMIGVTWENLRWGDQVSIRTAMYELVDALKDELGLEEGVDFDYEL
jgi:hypothetical protein